MMDPIVTFLLEHWMLSSAFVVILLLLALNEWRHRSLGVKGIDTQQLVNFLNHQNGVVVDVRLPERFDQGHILNAINLPQADFQNKVSSLNKYKAKPIILVCATGIDAPKMGQLLTSNGFTQLYYLSGGMGEWQASGMPVVKK